MIPLPQILGQTKHTIRCNTTNSYMEVITDPNLTAILTQTACMRQHVYFIVRIGPGGFAFATRGGICNAKLAIVITYFQSFDPLQGNSRG